MEPDTQQDDNVIVLTTTDSNCVTCEPIKVELDASSVDVEAFSDGKCVYSKTQPFTNRTVNVENLSLEELDAEVARLEGVPLDGFHPSTNPAQGHPIMERMHITPIYFGDADDEFKGRPWGAESRENGAHYIDTTQSECGTSGATALIAAMREYVRWSWENKR